MINKSKIILIMLFLLMISVSAYGQTDSRYFVSNSQGSSGYTRSTFVSSQNVETQKSTILAYGERANGPPPYRR